MKLAVIGSGNIGKSIGSWAAQSGYEVLFSAKHESHAQDAAKQAGHQAKAGNVRSVVEAADMILLAVPYGEVPNVIEQVRPLLKGKTLIDATNAVSADYGSLILGHTTSAAEEIARLAPEAKVVKAFNTVFAPIYASKNPKIAGRPVTIFLAGDDANAKSKVGALAGKFGFDVVDAGGLKAARNIEPLAMLNISLGYGQGLGTGIGFTLLR